MSKAFIDKKFMLQEINKREDVTEVHLNALFSLISKKSECNIKEIIEQEEMDKYKENKYKTKKKSEEVEISEEKKTQHWRLKHIWRSRRPEELRINRTVMRNRQQAEDGVNSSLSRSGFKGHIHF